MLEVTFEPGVQVVSFVGGGKGNHATSVRCGFRSGPRCLYHQHQWPAVSVLTLCVLRLLGDGRHRGGGLAGAVWARQDWWCHAAGSRLFGRWAARDDPLPARGAGGLHCLAMNLASPRSSAPRY